MKWQIYNRSLIPTWSASSTGVNVDVAEVKQLIKKHKCILARWSSDWDCGYKTEWWECINDKPISFESLSAKQRYRVKRGLKAVEVSKVNPVDYAQGIYDVQKEAWEEYPIEYRPIMPSFESFKEQLSKTKLTYFIATDADKEVCAYAITSVSQRIDCQANRGG